MWHKMWHLSERNLNPLEPSTCSTVLQVSIGISTTRHKPGKKSNIGYAIDITNTVM